MSKAMVTGSFDPVTIGHLDLVRRALEKYDEVCIGVLINPEKSYAYTLTQRLEFLRLALTGLGVSVYHSDGLAVDLAKSVGADVMVRGIRPGDEAYEAELARLNQVIGGVSTEFIACDKRYANVSSTMVKERLARGEDVSDIVPAQIVNRL